MFEHKKKTLLSRRLFYRRVLLHTSVSILAILLALGVGVLGYHVLGELNWVDSILNAAMILGGMGPVNTLDSNAAKLFSAAYALFSGLFFIGVAALLIAPFAHRLLHRFHLDSQD
jgi:sterol desaturase/sphingolipid hydroxylase (fatty acid hydroxylase superfamily)